MPKLFPTHPRLRLVRTRAVLFLASALSTGPLLAAPEEHAPAAGKAAAPADTKSGEAKNRSGRYDSAEVARAFIIHPMPRYPYGAYLTGARGRGVFEIDFGKDGNVVKVEVLQSTDVGLLDRECVQTFKLWRARRPGGVEKAIVPVVFEGKKGSVRWGI